MATKKMTFMHSSVAVALCFLPYSSVKAQQDSILTRSYRHEISIGCGSRNILSSPKKHSPDAYKWWKVNFHLQYLYNLNNTLGLGVCMDYTRSYHTKTIHYNYDIQGRFIGGNLIDEKNYTNWYTLNATCRKYWYQEQKLAVYSRVGLGVAFATGAERKMTLIPNLSPASLEFGGTKFRLLTEFFSIGTYGVINLGIKYSF